MKCASTVELAFAFVLLIGACVGPAREAPLAPEALARWVVETHDASRAFVPPAQYRIWWAELVQECGCRPAARFDDLQFYALRGNTFACARAARCYGAYVGDGIDAVFLADLHVDDPKTVRHELLHAVLGTSHHPSLFWQLGLLDPGER
jgi:hypothetical protein